MKAHNSELNVDKKKRYFEADEKSLDQGVLKVDET
jgi:hypothetical protein